MRRELKRGVRYDAVIRDPPSYGHGRRGEVWRLSKHLPELLEMCGRLTHQRRRFMLLTCHTPKYTPRHVRELMGDAMGDAARGAVAAKQLVLRADTGEALPSGVMARWTDA